MLGAQIDPDGMADYTQTAGSPTNASFTGPWIPMASIASIGFQVVMAGTSNPVGSWGVDITDDLDPVNNPILGPTALTLTSAMTAQNPSGTGAAVNFLFDFSPRPDGRWCRFKYVSASGGSASKLLLIGAAWRKSARGI